MISVDGKMESIVEMQSYWTLSHHKEELLGQDDPAARPTHCRCHHDPFFHLYRFCFFIGSASSHGSGQKVGRAVGCGGDYWLGGEGVGDIVVPLVRLPSLPLV